MSDIPPPPRKAMEVFIWSIYASLVTWLIHAIITKGSDIIITKPTLWVAVVVSLFTGACGLYLLLRFLLDIWCASWDKKVAQRTEIKKKKKEVKKKSRKEVTQFKKELDKKTEGTIFGQ